MKSKVIHLLIIASVALLGCKNSQSGQQPAEPVQEEQSGEKTVEQMKNADLAFDPASLPEEPVFDINTTEGTIRVKLYKETPLHRDNFVKLASERFYDNILFHRVIKGFMIQTGDPNTKNPEAVETFGTGGPGYTIPAEIVSGFTHKKGALAAARKGDTANPNRESSGSQFYIVQDAAGCSHLDGDYTIFGETVSGIDVVDKIADIPVGAKSVPEKQVKIISILPAEQ